MFRERQINKETINSKRCNSKRHVYSGKRNHYPIIEQCQHRKPIVNIYRIRNHHEVAYNDGKSEEPLNHKSEDDNKSKPDGTEKPDGPEKTEPEKPFDPNNPDPDTPNPPDDGEIHVLGYTNVEIEGQEHFAGHLYDGDHIYLIDIDKDDNHEYDIAISDNNKDGKLTMNESIDISEYHYTRERLFIDAVLEGTSNQVATNTQDDISPDTPDYVNDANTTI